MLYFKRSGGGMSNIFRSRFINGNYEEPEKLGDAINSDTIEDHPFIAPDERYLLFSSWRRPDGYGEADLYISSPDGKYFFFNSYKKSEYNPFWEKPLSYDEALEKLDDIYNGFPNIYWVDAKIIETLRPKEIK